MGVCAGPGPIFWTRYRRGVSGLARGLRPPRGWRNLLSVPGDALLPPAGLVFLLKLAEGLAGFQPDIDALERNVQGHEGN